MGSQFSIAMCTYNASRYLEQELESFVAQKRLPDELVVCDNVSSDNTIELLERFRQRAPFPVRIYRNETNVGRTKNFEKSIGLCECDYIATADFDDIWLPDRVQLMCEVLDADRQAGYAFSNAQLIDANGNLLPGTLASRPPLSKIRDGFPPERQAAMLVRSPVVTGSTLVMRADLRSLALPMSRDWVQDYWITLLASAVGRHGILVPEPTIQYRLHASQEIGISRALWAMAPDALNFPKYWKAELDRLVDARERLYSSPEILEQCLPSALRALDDKIAHLKTRLRANAASHWRKPKIVFAESRTGRYKQFSESWVSVVRDLLL